MASFWVGFITATTLGCGDLSPGTDFGHRLVVLEALIASIYMVTLVARLVGMYGQGNPAATSD